MGGGGGVCGSLCGSVYLIVALSLHLPYRFTVAVKVALSMECLYYLFTVGVTVAPSVVFI